MRWRRKDAPNEVWEKAIPLRGVLAPAPQSACDLADSDPVPSIRFTERDDGLSWLVEAEPVDLDESYYLLERGTDMTIRNIDANIVYVDIDVERPMELSDEGEIIQLIDDAQQVIDTANAFESPGGWPAGDTRTFGTMERTNPLGPDEPDNWHTNLGIVTRGLDADERPLVATADVINSQTLEEMELFVSLDPTDWAIGDFVEVGLDLPRSERTQTGMPWIRVSQPTVVAAGDVAGEGGGIQPVFMFTSRYDADLYMLGIDTTGLPTGNYLVWAVYDEGETVLVPITVQ